MARTKKAKPSAKRSKSVRAKPSGIDEKNITKGQIRKLHALRKSLGDAIADKAFAQWLKSGGGAPAEQVDKNAQLIADTLGALVNAGRLRIPRGGYLVTRGRKRVIVAGGGGSAGNG